MSNLVNPSICIPHLRDRLKAERDNNARTAIRIAINILEALPGEKIDELVVCKDCWFYNSDKQKCRHINGLTGKVFPTYYCPFASKDYTAAGQEAERFEDFEEDNEDE